MDWTYYKKGQCESNFSPSFYGPCYEDESSFENIRDELDGSLQNNVITISVKEGGWACFC